MLARTGTPKVSPHIRKVFTNPLVLNSDYDATRAEAAIESGAADALSFGRPFLANPDLPRRIREGLPLNQGDIKTWWRTRGRRRGSARPRSRR